MQELKVILAVIDLPNKLKVTFEGNKGVYVLVVGSTMPKLTQIIFYIPFLNAFFKSACKQKDNFLN